MRKEEGRGSAEGRGRCTVGATRACTAGSRAGGRLHGAALLAAARRRTHAPGALPPARQGPAARGCGSTGRRTRAASTWGAGLTCKGLQVREVSNPQAIARGLGRVGGADAALGRANLLACGMRGARRPQHRMRAPACRLGQAGGAPRCPGWLRRGPPCNAPCVARYTPALPLPLRRARVAAPRSPVPASSASRAASISLCRSNSRCARSEMSSRPSTLTPRSCMPRISSNRDGRCTTTPLPMTHVALGLRMPLGMRCSLYLLPAES